MPELTVKEVRLPELRLPELKRDEIIRALNEIRVPAVEMPRLALDLSARPGRSAFDAGAVVAGLLRVVRRAAPAVRRPRWPIAIGILAVLGLVVVALVRSPAGREATERASRLARERVDALRASAEDAAGEAAAMPIEATEPASVDPRMSDVVEVMASIEDVPATEPTTTPV
jgi:hypothetical protein